MAKVVIDTSVFVAAILSKNSQSAPNQVVNKWRQGYLILIISPQILEELVITLLRQKISVIYFVLNQITHADTRTINC